MEQAMLLVFFNFVLTCLIFNDPVISETLLDWAARVPADCPRVGTFVAAAVIQMFIYAMVAGIDWIVRERAPRRRTVDMDIDDDGINSSTRPAEEGAEEAEGWPWTGMRGEGDPWVHNLERAYWNLRVHNTQLVAAIAMWTADNTWLCETEDKLTMLVSRQFDVKQALIKKVRQLEKENKELKEKLSNKTDHVRSLEWQFDVDVMGMFKSMCKHEADAKSAMKTIGEMSTAFASVILEVVATHGDASLKAVLSSGKTMAQLVEQYSLPVYGPRTRDTTDICSRPCSPSIPCPVTPSRPTVSPAVSPVMSPAAYMSLCTKPNTYAKPAATVAQASKRSPAAASAHCWSQRH